MLDIDTEEKSAISLSSSSLSSASGREKGEKRRGREKNDKSANEKEREREKRRRRDQARERKKRVKKITNRRARLIKLFTWLVLDSLFPTVAVVSGTGDVDCSESIMNDTVDDHDDGDNDDSNSTGRHLHDGSETDNQVLMFLHTLLTSFIDNDD